MFLFGIMFLICLFIIFIDGITNVFMVNNIIEQVSLSSNLDVSCITDMSNIVDTTDVSDYIDYISFVNNNNIEEERYWLYQYFDDFIKLFRKDGGIDIKHIHYIEDKIGREQFNFDYNSVSVYKEVLRYEVLRLIELCEHNAKITYKFCDDLSESRRFIDVYKDDIRELEVEKGLLDEELTNLRRNLSNLQREYNIVNEQYSGLYGFSHSMLIDLSGRFHSLQLENDWFRANFNPQIYINLWYR